MMSKKPGITLCVSITETRVSMIHLVKRSSVKMAAAIPRAFARGSRIGVIVIVLDRLGAGAADRREIGIRSHIGRILPATLAFQARGTLHLHRHLAAGRALIERYLRNNEQSRQ